MSALLNALSGAKQVGTVVRNIQLMTDVTVEYFTKGDMEMTFCKGIDVKSTLEDSILVSGTVKFSEAKYVSLVNVSTNEKGTKANQASKLTKKEFDALRSATQTSDVI